jgi:hypothetical protein
VAGDVLEYEAFIEWLGRLPRHRTRLEVNQGLVLAIAAASRHDSGVWHFRFISGDPTEIPLVYVEATGETVAEEPVDGRWRATPTRVSIDPTRRLLAVELRRAGVGATNLERYMTRLAKREGFHERLSLEMNPLPSPSFEDEIDDLARIREASIIVRRPNTDWDDADDILSDLADASAAHKASVTVNAARGESLSASRGVMSLVREHLRRPLTNVSNVRVTGTPTGSSRERTVSLEKHQFQGQADVPPQASLREEDSSLFDAQKELLDQGARVVAELSDLKPHEVL